MRREVADVTVIGGGIMGCALSYYLAKSGREVVLLERGELNREASGANAGTIHLQVRQHEDRAPGRLALIRSSAAAWRELTRELKDDLDLRLRGGLMLAETPDEVEALRAKRELDASLGLEPELLTSADLARIEPNLSAVITAASYCPHEGSVNPLRVAPVFAHRAREAGARIHTHSPVISLRTRASGGFSVQTPDLLVESGRVACAAGAWTSEICTMLGLDIPVWACPLSVSVTEALPPVLQHVVQHIGRQLSMKQTSGGTILIGGGWLGLHREGVNKEARFDSILGNAWVALRVLPLLAEARLLRTWTGVLPVTADGRPVLGEHPDVPGFYVLVVPLGAAGYTVAPVVTLMLAELIISGGKRLPDVLEGYAPTRNGRQVHEATMN